MKVINTLKNLGFTEYEAKAYLALLNNSPLTGYAVAKNSGVPRSKIYEVLDTLVQRGDILVSPGDTPVYQAVNPTELITIRRMKNEKDLLEAEKELKEYKYSDNDRQNIWNITGYENIIRKINACIDNSKERILVEIWKEDYDKISDALIKAAKRGVSIYIISYGGIEAEYAKVYEHDMSEKITNEYGGRWIVFSADNTEVVAGVVSLENNSRAAWTIHRGLVMPITEVIIHDLYIAEILKKHRNILEKSFGKNLINLRKEFSLYNDDKKHYIE